MIGWSIPSVFCRSWTLVSPRSTSTSSRRIRTGWARARKNSGLRVWSGGEGMLIKVHMSTALGSRRERFIAARLVNVARATQRLIEVLANVGIADMAMKVGARDEARRLVPGPAEE